MYPIIDPKEIMNSELKLILTNRSGQEKVLYWVPMYCQLFDKDHKFIEIPEKLEQYYKDFLLEICITLGSHCNFRCKYCYQHPDGFEREDTPNVPLFLSNLTKALQWYPERVSFHLWGGEPLLYWDIFKTIVEHIRSIRPNAIIFTITNGSLLDLEKAKWLMNKKVYLRISHDGEAQHLRTEDPLAEGSPSLEAIKYYIQTEAKRIAFSSVFCTNGLNSNRFKWFCEHFGNQFLLSDGWPAIPLTSGDYSIYLQDYELPRYSQDLFEVLKRYSRRCLSYSSILYRFLHNLRIHWQVKPGRNNRMFSDLPYSIDLQDNICYNADRHPDYVFSANNEPNKRGSFSEFAKYGSQVLRPYNLPAWESNSDKRCYTCPVLPLCLGGRTVTDPEPNKKQCDLMFWHMLGLFKYALYLATDGYELQEIQGSFYHAK